MSTSYLTITEADTLSATVPGLSAWAAATNDQKTTALNRATFEIDNAMPYQGRKYAPEQATQFPRVADDEPPSAGRRHERPYETVWDWDAENNQPVVPHDVLLAVLFQADAAIAGERDARLAAQHDGIVYDQSGSIAESYKRSEGPGVKTGLCRTSWILLRKYRLRGGRLL